ncbi:hypothetical protein [Faecalicoccus pleomorphus]|mgnify:CR=1 FL=1|uniref:hypothetical protein n=1 Tax=Faecalicoccus pleomorphus TaxID=1323 RepID=UPI0029435973|nr:hypothetical protein [Faecalicoccus pleomorphus]
MVKKKKMSVDFSGINYKVLDKFAKRHEMSKGAVINFLIENLMSLDESIYYSLSQFIVDQILILDEKFTKVDVIERNRLFDQRMKLVQLLLIFNNDPQYLENELKKRSQLSL